jgi:hypothetical protein
MFRNRAVLVKLSKTPKDQIAEEPRDKRPVEDKVGAILKKLDKPALKVFGCVCVFVLLDTFRQVQVARAQQPYEPETE